MNAFLNLACWIGGFIALVVMGACMLRMFSESEDDFD